jgi:hypothetical protein
MCLRDGYCRSEVKLPKTPATRARVSSRGILTISVVDQRSAFWRTFVLKGDGEGFTRGIRNFGGHALRQWTCIERTFVHAGHLIVRREGGSRRMAYVKSSDLCLAAMNAGQKQGRRDGNAQDDRR